MVYLECITEPQQYQQIIVMGGCSSASADQAVHPVKPSKMPQVLFLAKHKFPVKEIIVPHGATANNKITDLVIKNKDLRELQYTDLYERILKMKNGKYTDDEFPAKDVSIGSQSYSKNVEWKRPEDFIKGKLNIFEGSIEPKDIRQGRLGNCYLMSALILISDHPEIIKRLFETTEVNELGMYGIWLCVDGEWKIVIVDDFIPTEDSRTLFSRNNGPEMWVVMLEKAYAKAYGSYNNIEKGLVGVAVETLTGAPYEYFQKDSKSRDPKSKTQANELWNFIKKQDAAGRMLAGSSEANDRNDNLHLVSQHAYAILDVQEVTINTKKGEKNQRLLKLANPWGQYEWKGNWSDKSPLWTPELKEKLNLQDVEDGTFWMNIEDFHQNFGQVCSSKYDKDYVYSFAKLEFGKEPTGCKGVFLNLNRKTKGFLNLVQKDHRFFKQQYKYALIRVIILQINSTSRNLQKYIDDMMDCDRDTCLQVSLEAGQYYIAIEADWGCDKSRQLVVSFYGEHGVQLLEDTEPPASYDSFLNEIILLHELFTEKQRINPYPNDVNIKRVTGSLAGYVYYHYKNDSKDEKYLCETVTFKEHKYIKTYKEELEDQFSVKVLPGEEKIVKLRVESEGNGYYTYTTKILYYVVEGYTNERLRQLCDKKPTKIKKRQVEGKPIDVIVKTFSYSGGIAVLYQNKMDKYAFIEQLTLDIENLELENEVLNKKNQIQIELQPQSQKLLSFIVCKPGLPVVFRTTMSFYLNSPEFKF